MATLTLILQALIAVLKFPAEMSKFIKLVSKSPEEKRAEIVAQVDKWMEDSATSDGDGEVEPPKWDGQSGRANPWAIFLLGAVFFAACGTAEIRFPYKYFHISPANTWEKSDGKLLGDGITYELSKCKPVKNSEGKSVQQCVVMFYSELNKAIADYKTTKQQLIDCQRGR